MYVFNLITFTKLCSLLTTFFNTQQTFQHCLNIIVRVIWHHNVKQCQINVEIYNFEQHQIDVVYFNININNVRQHQNNVIILSVAFHSVNQCQNRVLNMTFFKKLKRAKKYFWASEKRWLIWLTILAVNCDRLKKNETWNTQCKKKCWKVYWTVHERNMKITKWVCWWRNRLMYGKALLVLIYMLFYILLVHFHYIYFHFSVLFYRCYYFLS